MTSDSMPLIVAVLSSALRSGTGIAFAAVGETFAERAGVINLGIEGMMLVGAMAGVMTRVNGGSLVLAVVAAGVAAMLLAALHAYATVGLGGNQIVSGIALSIVGTGLSGFFGRPYVGVQFDGISPLNPPGLASLPIVGPILFQQDVLVYVAIVVSILAWWVLFRTRLGLDIRAVGENPDAAFAHGVAVVRVRVTAILVGGFLAGVGGAYLSLAYTHLWAEKMTAGQGWIAVGLVIAARWRPIETLIAAYAFGALTVLHPHLQATGIAISPYFLAMVPYLGAIIALVVTTRIFARKGHALPAALTRNFQFGRSRRT
ncbi:MAG: ral nucleoside transport system permease protein [Acidobacteriota bacterium]|jgi:simple sugar transport system permease protein|nr:ral nucleoside transport system permease protein [Acidobacteriota bacterium]